MWEAGPIERQSYLVGAHNRLRTLLGAVASVEWTGADAAEFEP